MGIHTISPPNRPDNIQLDKKVKTSPRMTGEFVPVGYHSVSNKRTLGTTTDDVELTVSLETYDRMENDATITKSKRIIITNVLTDEMQFAPGAADSQINAEEYANYIEIMQFCERIIDGLDKPYRASLAQLLGNGIKYGHGIAEIEWEYRYDTPTSPQTEEAKSVPKKTKLGSFFNYFGYKTRAQKEKEETEKNTNPLIKARREEPQLRLMPKGIKVKPRGTCAFVVDDYFNVLGIAPRRKLNSGLKFDEILDRRKFLVLTMNEQDEDPRGRSFYRPIFNWFNLKSQMPSEILRYIVEESTPKIVGTLPEEMKPYEVMTDELGNVIKDENDEPVMLPTVLSFRTQMGELKKGAGIIIPHGAKIEPLKKGYASSSDSNVFNNILRVIEKQMENGLLLQNLAQSEGEHQARSASDTHKELLNAMAFWIRWMIAVMTTQDLCKQAVIFNYGEEYLKYMPFVSLGDFVRRDWARDLEVVAKAYFQGFIDDTQRPELMAWLNLPEPGPSRASLMAEADENGEPVMPNNNRPDKSSGNKDRNKGNGTEKKNNANIGRSTLNFLGYHGKRVMGFTGNILSSTRKKW